MKNGRLIEKGNLNTRKQEVQKSNNYIKRYIMFKSIKIVQLNKFHRIKKYA